MFLSNALRRMRRRAIQNLGDSHHVPGRLSHALPLVLEALEDRCLLTSYRFALLADDGPSSPLATFPTTTVLALNAQGTASFRAQLRSGGEGSSPAMRRGTSVLTEETSCPRLRNYFSRSMSYCTTIWRCSF
jgi:hypothetical protein